MAGQDIDAVFAAIIKDCQAVAVEAVKNAAKKAQNKIVEEAKSYLQEYYANYSPKMYKRTYRLRRAIIPYWADRIGGKGVSIEVGVQYNSSALKGAYKSNSRFHKSGDVWISRFIDEENFNFDKGDNGIPSPEWIMTNFLEGQHGGAQQDDESTNTLMQKFFDTELPNHIEQYIQESLFAAITSRL